MAPFYFNASSGAVGYPVLCVCVGVCAFQPALRCVPWMCCGCVRKFQECVACVRVLWGTLCYVCVWVCVRFNVLCVVCRGCAVGVCVGFKSALACVSWMCCFSSPYAALR